METPYPLHYVKSSTVGTRLDPGSRHRLWLSGPRKEHPILSRDSSGPPEAGPTTDPYGSELQLSDATRKPVLPSVTAPGALRGLLWRAGRTAALALLPLPQGEPSPQSGRAYLPPSLPPQSTPASTLGSLLGCKLHRRDPLIPDPTPQVRWGARHTVGAQRLSVK